MRKTEEWLKELPAPLNEWALSQVNKNWEGWRDECFSLQKAIICFAEWHKTKEGWRYWHDVAFNDLHKHPDVVAYRKTLTNQEKDLQMEGKSEKQHGDITRKFLAERGLKEKDWYGTAKNGDIQEVDLRELLQDYASHVKAFQNKKLLKATVERGEL